MRRSTLTAVLLAISITPAHADAEFQSYLEHALEWLRHRDNDPAIAALVEIDGKVAAQAAIGVRAVDHPQVAVTIDDRWHIGSNTKAFTATLIGTLVDRHTMTLDDTLASSFPAFAKTMNPAYRRVTVRQLLSHTAGLPPLTNTETDFPTAVAVTRSVDGPIAQRLALTQHYLSRPPASPVGKFRYSNLGFVIAGAIAEARTGKTWEDLMRERVFFPLDIHEVGFGPPGDSGKYDQPLGHGGASGFEPLDPRVADSDVPAWLGPAGIINISLKDWARFAQDQLDGVLGHGKLLRPSTYRLLQTPVSKGYALGWGAFADDAGGLKLLTHEGSNGFWVAAICIYPKRDTILLMATNFGGEAAKNSIEYLGGALAEHLGLGN